VTGAQARPKTSWLLLVIAVLSFIPSFGLVFAAIAITWGLLSDRPRARLAVVLSAVGALLTVLEVIALMVYVRGSKVMTDAQVASARHDLAKIVVALEDYRSKRGEYPPDLQTLVGKPIPTRLLNINDHSSGLFHLGPYHYEIHEDGTYDVFAVGPDGQAGTADDVRPVLSDSFADHSGYGPRDSKRPN